MKSWIAIFLKHNRSNKVLIWSLAVSYLLLVLSIIIVMVIMLTSSRTVAAPVALAVAFIFAALLYIMSRIRSEMTPWANFSDVSNGPDFDESKTASILTSETALEVAKQRAEYNGLSIEDYIIQLIRIEAGCLNLGDYLNNNDEREDKVSSSRAIREEAEKE